MGSTCNFTLVHLLMHKGSRECWLACPHDTHAKKGQPKKGHLESVDPFHCEKNYSFTIWYFFLSAAVRWLCPCSRTAITAALCPDASAFQECPHALDAYLFLIFTIMYLFTFKRGFSCSMSWSLCPTLWWKPGQNLQCTFFWGGGGGGMGCVDKMYPYLHVTICMWQIKDPCALKHQPLGIFLFSRSQFVWKYL